MTVLRSIRRAGLVSIALLAPLGAVSAGGLTPINDKGQVELLLKDHRFSPAEIHVAANKPVAIHLVNQDDTADEFDSTALRVEKVVGGGAQGIVRLSPLQPGQYAFMGEFHSDTAQGVVVAE